MAPPPALAWHEAPLAPIVLVRGPEGLLAERAVDVVTRLATDRDPEVERTRIEASTYRPGMLAVAASPSLFSDSSLVIVWGAEMSNDDMIADVIDYVAAPDTSTTLVIVHGGGVRGKKMLESVIAAGAAVVAVDAVKRDAEKASLVTGEFRRARRRVDAEGVRALLDAVGSDLRELVAACGQLIDDTTGTVTAAMVAQYYGGRIEATGFKVADAAATGDAGQALALVRHALDTGADPVPIVAALAMKLRGLAKVGAMRGRAGAKDLGMAPWQIDRATRELAGWTPEGLAAAITAVANADAQVKGGGRDPVYAVEHAVLRIVAAHGSGR